MAGVAEQVLLQQWHPQQGAHLLLLQPNAARAVRVQEVAAEHADAHLLGLLNLQAGIAVTAGVAGQACGERHAPQRMHRQRQLQTAQPPQRHLQLTRSWAILGTALATGPGVVVQRLQCWTQTQVQILLTLLSLQLLGR